MSFTSTAADESISLESAVAAAFSEIGSDEGDEITEEVDEEAASEPEDDEDEDKDEIEDEDPEPEGEEPEGEEESPTEEDDEDPTVTVVVDGEEIEVPLSEALKGYQRQADYTRKTQALAEESKRVAAVSGLMESLQRDPAGTLAALAQHVGVALPTDTPLGSVDDDLDEADPLVQRLRQVEAQLASQAEREQAAAMQAEIDRSIAEVKQKYEVPDLDDLELLQYAVDNEIPNLDAAYRAFAFDKQKAQERDTKVNEKNRKVAQKRKASVVSSGKAPSRKSVDRGAKATDLSLDEIIEQAILSS